MFWLRLVPVYILTPVLAPAQFGQTTCVFWGRVCSGTDLNSLNSVNGRELARYEPDSKLISLNVNNEVHGNRQGGAGLSQPVFCLYFWIKEQEHEDSNMPDFSNMKCNCMKCMI